jgi:hypothetical protein
MNQRLRHDAAHGISVAVMAMFENLLREEELQTAYQELMAAVEAGIDRYEMAIERQQQKLHPLRPSEN